MSQQNVTESPEKAQQRTANRESSPDSAQSFQGGLHPIARLQWTLGNRIVAKLIQAKRLTLQTKKQEQPVAPLALRHLSYGVVLRQPKPPVVPADPYLARLHARLHATPRDLVGFYADIQADARGHAGKAGTRAGFETFITDGVLTRAQSMRAIALQELGPEASWPEAVKNFTQGVESAVFTISTLPPAGADRLREFCILGAGQAAEGIVDPKANYRNSFDARWNSTRFSKFSADFDPAQPSKGPRNARGHAIFTELYAEAWVKAAYDTNTPAGFRELCDTHAGPDNVNVIASPRIQKLRALLNPPVVVATGTADPVYIAFIGPVRAAAIALDNRDRQEIERSHVWRQTVDAKVTNAAPAVAEGLRTHLWSVVTTSRPAVPGGPAVAPPPVVVAPPPVPNAAQTAFLAGITITAPPSPQNAESDNFALPFKVRGPANPALPVHRRVVVDPAVQVNDGQDDDRVWPSTAKAVDHTALVNPENPAGPTEFTARLTMPPLAAATFPEKIAKVTVNDKRLDWFKANINIGAVFTKDTRRTQLGAGNIIHYHGGQMPMLVTPNLPTANPGLDIQMEGEIKKGAAVVAPMGRRVFGRHTESESLGTTILQEPAPAPALPEAHTIEVRFFQGAAGAAFTTLNMPFKIGASVGTTAIDNATITADNTWLNGPIGTPGTLFHHMDKAYGAGSIQQRVARAAASGAFQVKACTVRSDSRAAVVAKGGSPLTQVAYAMGAVDPIGPVMPNTLVQAPGADWWRMTSGVYLITRDSPHAGVGGRKPLAALAQGLAHEGIHATDRPLPPAGPTDKWPGYVAEFRAYWVEGRGAGLSTAFDASMDNRGPKSKRSRDIFDFLYTEMSATYPFVKQHYDLNTNGFRDKVNDYIFPDGINLLLSGHLTALRTEIEGYTGVAATFAAKKTAITAKFALCDATEKREISGNRDWRDLVDAKFIVAAERTAIKTLLKIPQ
jgi:hypothetical protein